MFLVKILNIVSDRKFQGQFDSIELAHEWIDKMKSSNSWGLPERKVLKKGEAARLPDMFLQDGDYVDSLVESEEEVIIQEYNESHTYETDEFGEFVLDENGEKVIVETHITPEVKAWYVNLKAEYEIEVTDLSLEPTYVARERVREKIKTGREIKKVCDNILEYIVGVNYGRLTKEQVDAMEVDLNDIAVALERRRPWTALDLIKSFTIDGTLVDEQIKSDILEIYAMSPLTFDLT